jgi:hypothetical protein
MAVTWVIDWLKTPPNDYFARLHLGRAGRDDSSLCPGDRGADNLVCDSDQPHCDAKFSWAVAAVRGGAEH